MSVSAENDDTSTSPKNQKAGLDPGFVSITQVPSSRQTCLPQQQRRKFFNKPNRIDFVQTASQFSERKRINTTQNKLAFGKAGVRLDSAGNVTLASAGQDVFNNKNFV